MPETTTVSPPSTGTFRVIGKAIRRAHIVSLKMGTRADGSDYIVQQPGEIEILPVGTELRDVTEQELAAFGDRFAPVDAMARTALAKARGVDVEAETFSAEDPPPPTGAPSSPADTPRPPDVVQEAPEVVAARTEGERRAREGGPARSTAQAGGTSRTTTAGESTPAPAEHAPRRST